MPTLSIVSHNQAHLLATLIGQLNALLSDTHFTLIITINTPENTTQLQSLLPPNSVVIHNKSPQGFSANHNAAFQHCTTDYFCVMNPDVMLTSNPFPALIEQLQNHRASLIAPFIKNPVNQAEDSIRYFPTLRSLCQKFFNLSDGRQAIPADTNSFHAHWVAGMFMLFRADDFRAIGGFDTNFFLYYEDVDICARLWKSGRKVMACLQVSVIHDARRTSRRNLRYMMWHASSMLRYFIKHWGRLPKVPSA